MFKKYLFTVLVLIFSFSFVGFAQAADPVTYKAAILMVNFPDNLTHVWSTQTAGNNLTEIANFHNENSYGNVIINGGIADVYGVYTITRTCDAVGIKGQASSAALAAGVDLSQYDIIIPVGSFSCGWLGVSVPGAIAAISNKQVIAHELGHFLGVPSEANFLNCGLLSLAKSGCSITAYGDPYSVMGNGMMYHMGAYDKMMLQYFKPENVINVNADGDYTIKPIELNTNLPQVLQIPVSSGSIQVEYRQWIGFDSLLPNSILTGALVRRGNELLDMTPTVPKSQLEPVLEVGNTFTDPNNVEITTLSLDGEGLTMRVRFLQPVVDIKANNSDEPITLESPATFTLNIDASMLGCTKSGAWSGSTSGSNSEQISNVGVGTYTYTLTCTNPAGSASDSVVVNVIEPITLPEVNINANGSTSTLNLLAPGSYSVSWTADNASLGCVNSGNWSGVGTGSYFQSFSSMMVGNYTYTVTCTNGLGSVTKTVYVVVNPIPIVSITTPTNNSMVSGTVPVVLDLADPTLVFFISFLVDEMYMGSFTGNPSTINWDTSIVSNGFHQIKARLHTSTGHILTQPISVIVNNSDTTLPTTAITSPAQSASVGSPVTISASASDNVGVTQVEIYVDSILATTLTSAPYSHVATLAPGAHSTFSKAYDLAGNTTTSAVVAFTVSDTTLPTTAITSPAQSASVGSPVTISASASDNVGVTKVEIYVDSVLRTTLTSAPYNHVISLSLGSHSTYSKAFDPAGNTKTSSTVSFTVVDTTIPNVSITAPVNGATVSRGKTTTIRVTATDNVAVTKVEFYVNGVLRGTDTTSSYTYNWAVPSTRNVVYTLMAKAYDQAGNTKTHTITVTAK